MKNKIRKFLKIIGPGLLLASTAIGTSHLVLSTRAGANHGLIFIGIILITLILKYPFFEYGPRYANATKYSLIRGYINQGKWAIILFFMVISINMFAVVIAIATVCGGLISTVFGLTVSLSIVVGGVLIITALLLIIGGYSLLDNLIKVLTIVLLITISIAFFAVLFKGPVAMVDGFESTSIIKGSGLILLLSLIGWMPSGMETSTMNSIWVVEKMRTSDYNPSLKESLLDFRLGYFIIVILALMFLVVGAFSAYGTGNTLEGNAITFSTKLLNIFTSNIGKWAYPIIAIAALGTIYGTLITAWDAFSRSFVRTLRVLKFKKIEMNEIQQRFLKEKHNIFIPIIGLGGFLLFHFSSESMIEILEIATIISFLTGPIIAFLNLKAIQSKEVPLSHRPSKKMIQFSYISLVIMVSFSVYYLITLVY